MNQPTIDAAQSYVTRGWRVFPLSPGSKEPWPRWNGWQSTNNATTPLDVIRVWTGVRESAGVAVVTGELSGVWVLDVDPGHGGDASLTELIAAHGQLPDTYTVATAGGGRHYYWTMPDEFEVPNTAHRLGPGLDTRGRAGYVVAPPTVIVRESGEVTRYTVASAPGVEPVKAPTWLVELLRPVQHAEPVRPAGGALPPGRVGQYLETALPALLDELIYATAGQRNGTAHRVACRLFEFVNAKWITPDRAAAEYQRAAATCLALTQADGDFGAATAFSSARRGVGSKAAVLDDDRIGYHEPEFLAYADEPPERRDFSLPTGGAALLPLGDGTQRVSTDPSTTPTPDTVEASPPAIGGLVDAATNTRAEEQNGHGPTVAYVDPYEALIESEVRKLRVRREAAKRLDAVEPIDWLGKVLGRDELDQVPSPEPLIADWLTLDTLARMFGPSGHGKSFAVLDMALSVSEGLAWHGRAVAQGPVVYVAGEGARGIKQRVAAWEERHGRRADGFRMLGEMPAVADAPNWRAFCMTMWSLKAKLIVLDTQAWLMAGLNENDAQDTHTMISGAKQLKVATGACVLLVHHTGKNEAAGGRGHSSAKGAVETEIEVRRDGSTVVIYSRKQKDGPDPAPLTFSMSPLAGSMVLDAAGDPGTVGAKIKGVEPELLPLHEVSNTRDMATIVDGIVFRMILAWPDPAGIKLADLRTAWCLLPSQVEDNGRNPRKVQNRLNQSLGRLKKKGRVSERSSRYTAIDEHDQ